jgi:hypothetical protein
MTSYAAFLGADKTANVVLSNGNLTVGASSSSDGGARAYTGYNGGQKLHLEITVASINGSDSGVGISKLGAAPTSMGTSASGGAILFKSGALWVNGSNVLNGATPALTAGVVVVFEVDLLRYRLWVKRSSDANWNNSGTANPATNTGGVDISALAPGLLCITALTASASETCTLNAGATGFAVSPSSGFGAWATGLQPLQHRYWRVLINACQSGIQASIKRLQLRGVAGGANVATTSGNWSASSQTANGGGFTYNAHNVLDGATDSDIWMPTAEVPAWIKYDLGLGVAAAVAEVVLQARTSLSMPLRPPAGSGRRRRSCHRE